MTCPVINLEKYLTLAGIDARYKSSDYLFKPLVKTKSGFKLIQKVKPLSYTMARESIAGLLKEFMPDAANLSLHSFRAGGASTAANAKVFLIGVRNAMGGGYQIQLKMAMSKIALSPVYLFQNLWEFEFPLTVSVCILAPFFVI